MGFYTRIRSSYGIEAMIALKEWAKLNIKLAKMRNRRIFLLECKRLDARPAHILQQIGSLFNTTDTELANMAGTINRFNKRLVHRILSLEIQITIKIILSTENLLNRQITTAYSLVPNFILHEYRSRLVFQYNRTFNRVKRLNLGKINLMRTTTLHNVCGRPQWLKNLTSTNIPEEVTTVLSLGPKFSIPPSVRDIPMKRLLGQIEAIIECTEDHHKDHYRARATNIVTNFVRQEHENKNSHLNAIFQDSRRFLKQNPHLMVCQSDKGNVTVIMDRESYGQKVIELVADTEVYKALKSDPTTRFQNSNNKLIGELKSAAFISADAAKSLVNYNSVPPRFFGLPKVHKENCPLRPIVSTINSPTSKLSKFIADVLKISFADYFEYSIKDSFAFAAVINDFQLPDDYVIVSLDVISLFTNISLEISVKIISDEWPRIQNNTNIPKNVFVKIIRFLFDSNYFSYNGHYYSQIFGCPMGSNLSPVLANIVMSCLLKSCIGQLSFTIPFIYQYVDDLILAIPNRSNQEILDVFNGFDQHIKFTIEEENNRSVPFLDTRVIRTPDNKIILDWYQKSIHSGRYINFYSYHSFKMKTNVILGLRKRIVAITHPSLRNTALHRLQDILKLNGYPKGMLGRLLFEHTRERPVLAGESVDQNIPANVVRFASIPYIENLSHKLINLFKPYSNIKIAQYNILTNKLNFTPLKDKLDSVLSSNVVYSISCGGCNGVYIGQTSQLLKKRLTLHKSDIRLRPERCALARHSHDTGHSFNFDDVKILELENNSFTRSFLEMCHINNHDSAVNAKSDINKLSSFYKYLLFIDKSRFNVQLDSDD